MARVAVIGAGVIGLSTAINIQQSIPGAHVTLVADKFNQYTTSDGSGAIIVPFAPGIDEATRRKWGHSSMDHFTKLAVSESSSENGAMLTMGIVFGPEPEPPQYSDLMLTFDPMSKATAQKLNLGKYHCFTTTTIVVEMRKYLPWLMKRFKDLGGIVVERHVQTFGEFADTHDLVVNCAGMGARELTGDDKLIPVRGQTFRVSAPWMCFFLQPSGLQGHVKPHFYPNSSNAIIGGVKEHGSTDLTVNPQTSKEMWKEVTTLWPPLKPAQVLYEWVGLRPHREPPRVESEVIRYGYKTVKIVHNYGHGATGVSLSWGTAVHATELVKRMLEPSARL